MTFIELEKTSGSDYDGLRLREKYLTVSVSMLKRMGNPKSTTIFYDSEVPAIGLKVIGGLNERKFLTSSKTHLAARLPDKMPRVRYIFKEEKDGMFICVHYKTP